MTRKNKLNSLVGPTLRPGREMPVAGVAIAPPQIAQLDAGGSAPCTRSGRPSASPTARPQPSSPMGDSHGQRPARALLVQQVVTSATCVLTDAAVRPAPAGSRRPL